MATSLNDAYLASVGNLADAVDRANRSHIISERDRDAVAAWAGIVKDLAVARNAERSNR